MEKAESGWKGTVLVGLLWLNFVALWIKVYRDTPRSDITDSSAYLAGILGVYVVLMTAWVLHNVRIHRSKPSRRAIRFVKFEATHDALKNYIDLQPGVKEKQEILIDVVEGRKHFVEASGIQPEHELVTRQ